MSLGHSALNLVALFLQKGGRAESRGASRRILVIRRNRMGDMICTLPLLHALRKHDPAAHIAVACDAAGAPIAHACAAVNEVIVLKTAWNRWLAVLQNAAHLQGYDLVIAAKGGFDRRLAALVRLTNATRRIGFEPCAGRSSAYYTNPVALPENPHAEHQIETTLRLLQPLGIFDSAIDLTLSLPSTARDFAATLLGQSSLAGSRLALINLSSTAPLKFRREDFIGLARRILEKSPLSIGFVSAPADQPRAREWAASLASPRVAAIATPGPLELAALLERAAFFVTPEGGAAHLAAVTDTPALVLWSEGPFQKWRSRGKDHAFVQPGPGEDFIPIERVWEALRPYLA